MNHDEQDQLWDLLGKAREPKASPFFANKVMCAIRKEAKGLNTEEEPRFSLFTWIRRWWLLPTAGGVCAALVAVALLRDTTSPQTAPQIAKADPLSEMVAAISATDEDFDNSLSDLLATEDHSVWLAADPSSLY